MLRCSRKLYVVLIQVVGLAGAVIGCRSASQLAVTTEGDGVNIVQVPPGETTDPDFALTLQADAAATADWVGRLTPLATSTSEASLDPNLTPVIGDPLASRTGACPEPPGTILQVRRGFCLSSPASWTAANVDGGAASTLNTTPGQMISLQPDWAESASVCNLVIYIAAEMSAEGHLEARYNRLSTQGSVSELTPIQSRSLGSLALPGFTWQIGTEIGAAYADVVGPGRIAHIGFSGTNCLAEDLLPVLETLRFNSNEF